MVLFSLMRRITKVLRGLVGRILFVVGIAFISGVPAGASTVLFSDLGTGIFPVYQQIGTLVQGSGSPGPFGSSVSLADIFGSGGGAVSEIDLGVTNIAGLNTFSVSIWTANTTADGFVVGTQISGASWTSSTAAPFGSCCALVSITGITGVIIPAGENFLVLAPVSLTDASENVWNASFTATGVGQSTDGGATWQFSVTALGAFDILGTSVPEPSASLMAASAIAVLFAAHRHKRTA
jgi:hypothetical protein